MSFNVFAAGSGSFHYQKDGFIDGGDFVPMKVVSTLMTMDLSVSGGANAYISYKTPGITDLMETMATMEFLHTLNDAVCFLAMCADASDGWISLSCTKSHVLWPDTKSFARYNFWPGDNPGAEFIKLIGKGLQDTDFDNWGTLAALSIVLAKYYDQIGQNDRPMINIMLDR
ncbi:MAG TPA: hypothetical protein VKU01_24230 [Bryobacteraceae bacterium]|nr:hypothetical protein [Bryobacteraceae bacterium]